MTPAADVLMGPAGMAFAVVWGAVWGSFFNVVIARLPRGGSVIRPPSHCLACGAAVRPFDNVPVLSYLWLRGRCRDCGARFSPRYPLVESLTAALSGGIWWAFVRSTGSGELALGLARFSLYFAFVGLLLVLAFIDLDTRRLPDVLTIPGALTFFVAGFAVDDVRWTERAIGVAAGYLFIRLIADFYYHVLKREGLGLGDGKLLAMIGALEGWRALPFVVFVASMLGSVVSIPVLLLARRRASRAEAATLPSIPVGLPAASPDASAEASAANSLRRAQIPFGPFIALAAILYLFEGRQILAWVLGTD